MNCKPGDLAVIVRSSCGNEGRIVQVIQQATRGMVFVSSSGMRIKTGPQFDWSHFLVVKANDLGWASIENETVVRGFSERPIQDADLRPIRDNPGEDETLTWAGKPEALPA